MRPSRKARRRHERRQQHMRFTAERTRAGRPKVNQAGLRADREKPDKRGDLGEVAKGMQYPLMPRMLWRLDRLVERQPKSHGFHMRQKPRVFDKRGEDMQGRIRAVIVRKRLTGPDHLPALREEMRKRLGREPTRREVRARMAKRYRGVKRARKVAA